ncbi:MAG: hypothetical protein L3J89_09590 [Gammaproteobacteria bacterium]|nr:hypothetical protein [Gammaproteobacteria bacterium]
MRCFLKTILIFSCFGVLTVSTAYAESEREFAGIKFGVGLSLTVDTGENSRVTSAELDENGIVRVSEEKNNVARIMLESHYFFTPKNNGKSFLGLTPAGSWGHGPFVAIQPGTDEIIEAIGLGWMVGFRRSKGSADSWNLGVGYVTDPSSKVLADGVTENQALPAGETQIRFKETNQTGVFILVSFGF